MSPLLAKVTLLLLGACWAARATAAVAPRSDSTTPPPAADVVIRRAAAASTSAATITTTTAALIPPSPLCAASHPSRWVNRTFYMLHPNASSAWTNHDVGDLLGDALFVCADNYSVHHYSDAFFTELTVEVDTMFGGYASCTDTDPGSCTPGARVPGSVERISNNYSVGRHVATFWGTCGDIINATGQCTPNTETGSWYSLPSQGECGSGSNCTWRVIEVGKTVLVQCLLAQGLKESCTKATPVQPSGCAYRATANLMHRALVASDPTQGGCAAVPPSTVNAVLRAAAAVAPRSASNIVAPLPPSSTLAAALAPPPGCRPAAGLKCGLAHWAPGFHPAPACYKSGGAHDIAAALWDAQTRTWHLMAGCWADGGWQHMTSADLLSWTSVDAPREFGGTGGLVHDDDGVIVAYGIGFACLPQGKLCFWRLDGTNWTKTNTSFMTCPHEGTPCRQQGGNDANVWKAGGRWWETAADKAGNTTATNLGDEIFFTSPALVGPRADWKPVTAGDGHGVGSFLEYPRRLLLPGHNMTRVRGKALIV